MSSSPLEHFVEHALEVHAPILERSFPPVFDWARLCRDVPALTERASNGAFDALDRVRAHRLQDQAEAVFRVAHTVALSVICAASDETLDPEAVLDRFDAIPDDDIEDRFEQLVGEQLGPAEEFLSDAEVQLDDTGVEIQRLHAIAWPYVAEYVGRLEILLGMDGEDPAPEEAWAVLMALARIATLLAAMRWMAEPDHVA